MPTETGNENPPTRASAAQERGAEGNAARAGVNPNNQQAGNPRTRTPKHKTKTDVKKFRGETIKMNGHVFQLHAERTNRAQFEDTMEALRIYASTVYKADIEHLNKMFTELMPPSVDEPPGPKETTKLDEMGEVVLDKAGKPVTTVSKFEETIYNERIKQ